MSCSFTGYLSIPVSLMIAWQVVQFPRWYIFIITAK
jgi:hypothetical protein